MIHLYSFEKANDHRDAIPLAAERALEAAGCTLKASAWRRIRPRTREALAALGAASAIDAARVRALVGENGAPLDGASGTPEAPPEAPPRTLTRALGTARPLDATAWRNLEPLHRWVLARLARQRKLEHLRRAYDDIVVAAAANPLSTHLSAQGHVRMVDVAAKDVTLRRAVARAEVHMAKSTALRLKSGATPKGDVLATARIAAIQATKRTPELIPLCHSVALTRVTADITLVEGGARVDVTAEARDRTGVEMEAMVGASTAALTIYDMLKGIDRGIRFEVFLLEKTGGKSGTWTKGP